MHTVRWVNALSQRGHKVILVSQNNHKAYLGTVSKKVKIIYLPFGGTIGYYLNAIPLKRLLLKNDFDVINVHYASGYGTLARIARLPKILLNVWGSDVYDFPYESKLKEKIIKKNLNYASKIASTSHCMAKQTLEILGCKKEIEITPFGVDLEKFKPSDKKIQNNFVFGTVKALSSKYGIETIIEAFALFLEKLPKEEKKRIDLEIYGKGELLKKLKMCANSYGIRDKVHFRGYITNDQVPRVLRKIDVFLLGSILDSESFGVAAVEAMACGIPIIATRVSGFKEVIKEHETGFLVPIKDAEVMADYMLQLYNDKELCNKMGKDGRRRVEKLYDWEKNVDTMIKIYKKMIDGEPKNYEFNK